MKKILFITFPFILLLSFIFIPMNNAHAEKVTYKWGEITYKANQIGKIVVKKNTNLYYWDTEYDELIYIGTLKKGEERPIYSTRNSENHGELLSIGNNQLVKNNSSVTFMKPSKNMRETVGKERVWLRNPDSNTLTNLQEAIILGKEKDPDIDYFDIQLKVGSEYYTLQSIKKGTEKWYYMTTNPFKKFKYKKATWDLIKKEKIQLGMTTNQVFLSWGYADDINTYESSYNSTEQWIYGNVLDGATYLYFENGKLGSWQKF